MIGHPAYPSVPHFAGVTVPNALREVLMSPRKAEIVMPWTHAEHLYLAEYDHAVSIAGPGVPTIYLASQAGDAVEDAMHPASGRWATSLC